MTRPDGSTGIPERHAFVVRFRAAALGSRRSPEARDLDLTIERGQFWFFLGTTTSAKKTLLRAVLGTAAPRAGSAEWNASFASRSRVGFVPRRCDIARGVSTSVRELIKLGLIGVPHTDIEEQERIAWALEAVGLAGAEREDYPTLARGRRRRVLLARALARRPRFLVIDDPTDGFDSSDEHALLDVLAALNRNERLTIAFFTESTSTAERCATHVALLSDGKLLVGRRGDPAFDEILSVAEGSLTASPLPGSPAVTEVGAPLQPDRHSASTPAGAGETSQP